MRKSARSLFVLCTTVAGLVTSYDVRAVQTTAHGLHAVPTPAAVAIDGKLQDWDLSGETLVCYDVEALKDVYAARVSLMYDADHLYVALRWADQTPMGNAHDPRYSASEGWAGDSVQLRVKTDRIAHLTAWYHAQTKQPFINVAYGKSDKEPFDAGKKDLFSVDGWKLREGAEMAFVANPDGKGYVQEIKIPWKLITDQKKYAAGDKLKLGIELLWGEGNWPVHRYADNLADGMTGREFFWANVPMWGTVTLEPKGQLRLPAPAWVAAVNVEETAQGPVKITYELPKDSRVTLAIDDADGKRVRNLVAAMPRKAGANTDAWDALDDAGKPVPAGRYTVKGLYHDGLHLKYVGSFASPGDPPWGNAANTGAFYGDHSGPQSVAAAGDLVALGTPVGEAGNPLIAVNLDGQRQWGLGNRFTGGVTTMAAEGDTLWIAQGTEGRFIVWRADLKTGKYRPWDRKNAAGQPVLDLRIPGAEAESAQAIAAHDGKVAVALVKSRRVVIVDGNTGDTVAEIADLPASIASLAYDPKGRLTIAAADGVYRVGGAGGKAERITSDVEEPTGIAVDKEGHLYVAQRGSRQNVTVFDEAGKKVGEIGKAGGRPAFGRFDETGMRQPRQIAIDSKGRLWVTEETRNPKRTSIWNADGTLAFDLIGPTGYAEGGILNPADPTVGFSEGVEYKIDFAKGTFRPVFALQSLTRATRPLKECKYITLGGHEYLQTKGDADTGGHIEIFMRQPDQSWRHVVAFGNEGSKVGYIWVDANGDGAIQPGERQIGKHEFGTYYWAQMMGDDLTVAMTVKTPNKTQPLVFKPTQIDSRGVPHYGFENAKLVTTARDTASEGMLAVGRDGRMYLNQSPLTAIDPSGKVLWTYPNPWVSVHGSHNAPAAGPGLLIGPSSFYGTAFVNDEVGEVFYLNGNLGQNFIFTEDGLWVQSLYKDTRGAFDVPAQAVPGMPTDSMTAGGESFFGGFCKAADGKYYTVGGATAAVVMEITGFESLRKFNQTIEVTDAVLLSREYSKVNGLTPAATAPLIATIRSVVAAPVVDGDLTSWAMDKDAVEIREGRNVIGKVKLVHDASNLYLAYSVKDATPLLNAGQNEREIFITGDGVDLMLRTDPSAKSAEPVAGDLRLLMTVRDGKPFMTLYQPVVPGTTPDARVPFSSPWRTIHMDRADAVSFPIAVKPSDGGYTVTAAVPLKLLGLEGLAKGVTLKGDVGVLASDSTGRETTGRHYWSNAVANNTNDVPDEAMLTPGQWGEFTWE